MGDKFPVASSVSASLGYAMFPARMYIFAPNEMRIAHKPIRTPETPPARLVDKVNIKTRYLFCVTTFIGRSI